ncbi:hypothetical protein WP12_22000 [Sphingomonas sp. SRS2]|nr:hypothetical protein WP12_22000 [Sphingomonas sp. SRS2]
MALYGHPRRPIFGKLDPRTIARDDTKVRFMDAKAEQIGNIMFERRRIHLIYGHDPAHTQRIAFAYTKM